MTRYSKTSFLYLYLLSGAMVVAFACWGEEQRQTAPAAEIRSHYDKPKSAGASEALDRCLADLAKAQEELRVLRADGKLRPHPPGKFRPVWADVLRCSNTMYYASFSYETGPMEMFEKTVFTDNTHQTEIHILGYRICYDGGGKLNRYSRRDGHQSLNIYPNGTFKTFYGDTGERAAVVVEWDAKAKIQSEKVIQHPPRNEKGLPELENAVRHGSESERFAAASTMIEIGAPSIPYALNVLKDGDARSREHAAHVFMFLREKGASAVPTLARCLRDDQSAKVRAAIALALGEMGSAAEPAIPALEEAATKDTSEVAEAAEESLTRIQNSQ